MPAARRSARVYGLPEIRETRRRRRLRCLRCGRSFSTVIDRRCCKVCASVNAALQAGELAEAASVLVLVQVSDG